jgi:gluconolactonase
MDVEFVVVATGLRFPEGPVWMADGSLIVTELIGKRLTRIDLRSGSAQTLAEIPGSPNGAAIGPDGALYICNSGGWRYTDLGGLLVPGDHHGTQAPDYSGGCIQRLDLESGELTTLYDSCDGQRLCAPNDLVFDATGAMWFTDHGHIRERDKDRTGLYYAQADGSSIREVVFPLDAPNGVGLAPGGSVVYVAETHVGRVWAWDLQAPGELAGPPLPAGNGGRLIAGLPGNQLLDSLAVDGSGRVCVATILNGGITVIDVNLDEADPDYLRHISLPDPIVTNICFGGEGLTTAYVTLSATGQVVAFEWPFGAGLALAF